jgi:hypothetical protein
MPPGLPLETLQECFVEQEGLGFAIVSPNHAIPAFLEARAKEVVTDSGTGERMVLLKTHEQARCPRSAGGSASPAA